MKEWENFAVFTALTKKMYFCMFIWLSRIAGQTKTPF